MPKSSLIEEPTASQLASECGITTNMLLFELGRLASFDPGGDAAIVKAIDQFSGETGIGRRAASGIRIRYGIVDEAAKLARDRGV
jgi:hypothetical protein